MLSSAVVVLSSAVVQFTVIHIVVVWLRKSEFTTAQSLHHMGMSRATCTVTFSFYSTEEHCCSAFCITSESAPEHGRSSTFA